MNVASTSSQGSSQTDSDEVENETNVGADDDNVRVTQARGDNRSAKKKDTEPRPRTDPLREVNRDVNNVAPEPVVVKRDLKKQQQLQIEEYANTDIVGNDYPKHTKTPVERAYLKLTQIERIHNGPLSKGEFHPDANVKCVICFKATDPDGNTRLIDCHGSISGEMKGPERVSVLNKEIREEYEERLAKHNVEVKKDPTKTMPLLKLIPDRQHACRSKFHLSCIEKYNAGAFFFQYSARLECQAKFLCPLHCCNRCNRAHQKQSAYGSELVECAKCLRAFHTQCYPAGARDQYVKLNTAVGDRIFEMIVCPCHPDDTPPKLNATPGKLPIPSPQASTAVDCFEIKKNIRGCFSDYCKYAGATKRKNGTNNGIPELIHCKSCIRSFHRDCCEVETIDGVPIADDQCEVCACKDDVPVNMPVLALWSNHSFWLAKTVSWYDFPSDRRSKEKKFEKSGYTVVEWLTTPTKQFSIVPVCHVAQLIESYIPLAPSSGLKAQWLRAFEEHDGGGYGFAPYVSKRVYQTYKTSKFYRSTQPKLHDHHGDCCCKENAEKKKCIDDSCVFVQEEAECVPECGKSCENRKVSTGFVSKKVELRDTKKYGYGVFAKDPISKGEFIAEYAGEIIDNAEKKRRLDVVEMARDFQANNYMMDLGNGLTVDACRYGNIARYINHRCEPNSRCSTTAIYNRRDKNALWYESRIYVEAMQDIAVGEEITFCYQMGNEETLPVCQCGAGSCLGYMTKTDKKTRNPKQKQFKIGMGKDQAVTKNSSTKEAEEKAKEARATKKREASQPSTSGPTPSKRPNSGRTTAPSTPVILIKNRPSTPASSAQLPKPSPVVAAKRKLSDRPSVFSPSSGPRNLIPSQSPSITGERRTTPRRAAVPAPVATSPTSLPQFRRISQRGRSAQDPAPSNDAPAPSAQAHSPLVQVPVQLVAAPLPVVQASAQHVQPPVLQEAVNNTDEAENGKPKKRTREPKRRFQIEL